MPLNRTALTSLIDGLYPDNTAQAITPEDIRNGLNELVTSLYNITEDDASTISFTSTSSNITAINLVDGVNQAGSQLKTLQDESNVDGVKITGDGTVGLPLTVAESGLDSNLLGFTSTNTNITATNLVAGINQAGAQVSDLQDYAINNLAPSKATFLNTHKGKYTGGGFVHMGKQHNSGSYSRVNQGLWGSGLVPNELSLGRGGSAFQGLSTTDEAQINVNNTLIRLFGLNRGDPDFNPCSIILPPAPDGLQNIDPTQLDFATLADAIAAGGVNLDKSVINRQDLVLLEVFHEKISDKDVVYPRGLVQYGNSTWEGITLSSVNVVQRYSAFHEGDISTVGHSALWSSLSPTEKALFIQDPENNIYADNGELIQVRARARTIRGLEGSWVNDGAGGSILAFESGNVNRVKARGALTTFTDYTTSGSANIDNLSAFEVGRYDVMNPPSSVAHDGQIYLIPICLVSRLNKGAYHPVYNSMGTKAFNRVGDIAASHEWYESLAKKPLNKSNCFDFNPTGGTGGTYFVNGASGGISNGSDGRMDGNRYDSIQAGYIRDLRVDANRTHTPVSAHHTLSKRARNGEARGWEKLPRIRTVFSNANTVNTTTEFSLKVVNSAPEVLGDISWIVGNASSGWLILEDGTTHKIHEVSNSGGWIFLKSYTLPKGGLNTGSQVVQAVFGDYIDAPYSEGLFQNITGTPAEIATTFPDGIMGEWIPVIPDGTYKDYKSTKKNLEHYQALVTSDSGAIWGNSTVTSGNTDNAFNTNQTAAQVRIVPFRAKANFTEETEINNVEPLHANFVSNFITTSLANHGSILCQSLIGQVSTDTAANNRAALPYSRYFNGFIYSVSTAVSPKTTLLLDDEISPSATSTGIQWENTLDSQDNLASLIIPYRQIKHNGTSYGAGLTFEYVDNTSNTLDDNGQLIQVGAARSIDDLNILLGYNNG